MMPWKMLESTQGYIFTWLIGYSALLGPIAGILIVDYFVRKTQLDVKQLYRDDGVYSYGSGWNMAAWSPLSSACCRISPAFERPFPRHSRRGRRLQERLYLRMVRGRPFPPSCMAS
jgi:cytosine/uracil/thiamine/allantoin permease